MSLTLLGSRLITQYTKITTTSPTDVIRDLQNRPVTIASIEIVNSTGIPNVSISITDPKAGVTYYKRNAQPLGTGADIYYDREFLLPKNWPLRVTITAGSVDVFVNYLDPNATGVDRGGT